MHSGSIHYQSTNGITQDSQGHWQGAKAITVSFANKLERPEAQSFTHKDLLNVSGALFLFSNFQGLSENKFMRIIWKLVRNMSLMFSTDLLKGKD